MSLTDLASLGSFVSGIAVVASLIYLAVQIQQNTRHTRALIHQGEAARTNSITLGLMQADYVAAWVEGNGIKPTAEIVRHRQFLLHCATAINALESHFLQHNDGLLSREQFARGCETFHGLLSEPGLRAYWGEYRTTIADAAPQFCRFVDSLCKVEQADFGNRV